jgi:3-deoxy-D-manno-octulosonic acid kinase
MELPAGFVEVEVDSAQVLLRSDCRQALLAAGIQDPQALVRRAPSELRGRGALASVALEDGGRAVVRPLTRGGLLGKLVRRVSLDRDRARAELLVSCGAAARGARVLEVLAAVTRPLGLGWTHALVTREVEGARDLLAALAQGSPDERRSALVQAGRAVRRMHDAGVDHTDLNLKNVLLTAHGEALVIDLDRCRLAAGPASGAVRRGNLLRLLRSWTKLCAVAPEHRRLRDPLRFLRAYAPDAADRPLRAELRAAGRRASFPLRRLWWRLLPPRSMVRALPPPPAAVA